MVAYMVTLNSAAIVGLVCVGIFYYFFTIIN